MELGGGEEEGVVHARARAGGGNAYNGPANCEAPKMWDWMRAGYATLHYSKKKKREHTCT